MRKITTHILLIVIAALATCMLALSLLVYNVDIVGKQYEQNIRKTVENQKLVTRICEGIYQTESLVWQHIVNDDEAVYAQHEERIDNLLQELGVLLTDLQDDLGDEADEELLHEAIRQYVGFKSNTSVVLELSRKDSKQSAQYYVREKLNPYFDMLNGLLEDTEKKMEENSTLAAEQMEARISMARTEALLCLIVVGLIIVICVGTVSRQGEKILGQQEEEQKNHQQRVMELQHNTIVAMANLIEGRDEDTGEHVKRTSWFVDSIARELSKDSPYRDQLNQEYIENLWKAAPLHDIGKIKIPDAILSKPGKLTEDEFEIMKEHAAVGGQIVYETMQGIEEHEYIEMAHDVAKYHHEKWDGSGYPEGRVGDAIPLCARIMAVADVFDALTSRRCYKPAMSIDEAYKIIEESSGSHFDPVVASAFLRLRPQVEEYLQKNKKE